MSDTREAWPAGGRDPWAPDPDPGTAGVVGWADAMAAQAVAAPLEQPPGTAAADLAPSPYADPYADSYADPDPHPDPRPEPGVPAPRGGSRRRRAAAPVPDTAPPPEPATAPGTGRRRGGLDTVPAPAGPGPGPGSGRRRAAGEAVVAPAGPGRRRGTDRERRRRQAGTGGASLESWRRIVPQALVVAFLAGGTTAFVAADKEVRLTVDGVPQTLHTFAGDVDTLLAAQRLGVGPHDLVAPAGRTALDDGDEIVVRYGRPLRLTLDGQRREVWTTARTVDGALRQLGIRAEGAYLSAPRAATVPRTGLDLAVRTERSITFMADGRESTIRTNAATVQEALDQAGITLHGEDTTSVPPGAYPRDGQTVTVLRITGTREVREERIPYETETVKDPALFAGTEVVERAGRPGARRVTYGLRTVNGVRQKPRKLAEETVREPVTQLVKVGTKPLPDSVEGADGLDWSALARCESGGRPGATDASGTYGGLYQFDVQTWQSLGGSGRPQDAPGQEQTFRAKKLYVQRGASPWPHCGRTLYR
ncbi:ubiquitin-like domain-containing protein [Streptomyces sp. NBC_00503]|uniref:ubiquitin-like domain-containing protein n=1 Tax=Streptomyces sp. NBC_00503 TaxID=2903659 RepID=UPI002E81191E|nr:ubiquitin-like domain-containing protein [Streptomyces sp. NBC_00503]WUD81715.1 ubiquitin-like domain-containing protein [Streptomyces sp. NBC_00503]